MRNSGIDDWMARLGRQSLTPDWLYFCRYTQDQCRTDKWALRRCRLSSVLYLSNMLTVNADLPDVSPMYEWRCLAVPVTLVFNVCL